VTRLVKVSLANDLVGDGHIRNEIGSSIFLGATFDCKRTAQRDELRILLNVRHQIEHIGGGVTDASFRGELGH